MALLESLKSRGDRIVYAALSIENGWSRNVLVNQIELGVADQHGTAVTNFKNLMPPDDSDMAEQALKGEYDLGFLPITVGGDEFEIDLLFYHVVLHRYIVIELKTGKFHPKDLGQFRMEHLLVVFQPMLTRSQK